MCTSRPWGSSTFRILGVKLYALYTFWKKWPFPDTPVLKKLYRKKLTPAHYPVQKKVKLKNGVKNYHNLFTTSKLFSLGHVVWPPRFVIFWTRFFISRILSKIFFKNKIIIFFCKVLYFLKIYFFYVNFFISLTYIFMLIFLYL